MNLEQTVTRLDQKAGVSCAQMRQMLARRPTGLGKPKNVLIVAGVGLVSSFAVWGIRPVVSTVSIQALRFLSPLPMLWLRQSLTDAGRP